MKISAFILLIIIALYSCNRVNPAPEPSDNKEVESLQTDSIKSTIYACMQAQEESWNNFDLEGFMSCYWQNDSLRFIGKSGLNLGWQKTLDNYKRSYPDSAAMGQLKFENLEFLPLSNSQAYVIGKWTLYRVSDTLSGHYSLLWQKKPEGWKIIADHSS